MLSFGSRRGGLDLARTLAALLHERAGWPEGAAYIDMENLEQHRDTRSTTVLLPDGRSVTKVLNPHWAEFYYMGLILMSTFVLVLDSAWQDSVYCAGEWAFFLKNALATYEVMRTGVSPESPLCCGLPLPAAACPAPAAR